MEVWEHGAYGRKKKYGVVAERMVAIRTTFYSCVVQCAFGLVQEPLHQHKKPLEI